VLLSGNFAVRFNMNIIESENANGSLASAAEGPVFGINHTGTCSNWWYGSGALAGGPWSSDGIWYWVDAQPSGAAAGDYQEFTGLGGTVGGVVTNTGWTRLNALYAPTFAQQFKDGVTSGSFTTFNTSDAPAPGSPANSSPADGFDATTWSDVEIKQQSGVVTMSINHTPIFVYTNTTAWTNGYLMLGYENPFGEAGTTDDGVYYANLQVVQLPSTAPTVVLINSIVISGTNVVITFTSSSATDTTSSFTVQSAAVVTGPFTNVSPAASIISLGGGVFQATLPYTASSQMFYQIND